jgi:hypothetical protein
MEWFAFTTRYYEKRPRGQLRVKWFVRKQNPASPDNVPRNTYGSRRPLVPAKPILDTGCWALARASQALAGKGGGSGGISGTVGSVDGGRGCKIASSAG